MTAYTPKDPWILRALDRINARGSLGCLILLLWIVISIPFIPFLWIQQQFRNSYFDRTLRSNGRMIRWSSFLEVTRDASGSIIIEVGSKRPSRFWWVQDSILAKAPTDPPLFDELDIIAGSRSSQHPFIKWCYETYVSLETGTAVYVEDSEEADFETFPFTSDYDQQMKDRFPNQEVIIVTFYDTRYP